MRVQYTCNEGVLKLKFILENEEFSDRTGKVTMQINTCRILLPHNWKVSLIHPDLFALSVILIGYPYIRNQINVGIGVSKEFHDEFFRLTGIRVVPIKDNLKPRKSKDTARPSLAFSGGVDSIVALSLLPENTCSVFLDRMPPSDMLDKKVYDKNAVYRACNFLANEGKEVYIIKTDLEYIRKPRGFAIEYSTSIPTILLADYLDGFDSIASGTVLESSYLEFKDFDESRLYNVDWRKLFNVVDLPRNDVTTGLSNVATLKILYKDGRYTNIAHSCMSGQGIERCMNCWKCFRKTLITKILLKEPINDDLIDRLFNITEARTYLKRLPLRFENQFAYITEKCDSKHPLMTMLRNFTVKNKTKYDWMEKWYSPSIEHFAPKYKHIVEENIKKYLKAMNKQEEKLVETWETRRGHLFSQYTKYHKKFVEQLKARK